MTLAPNAKPKMPAMRPISIGKKTINNSMPIHSAAMNNRRLVAGITAAPISNTAIRAMPMSAVEWNSPEVTMVAMPNAGSPNTSTNSARRIKIAM